MVHQHIEQAGELGRRGLYRGGSIASGQKLQPVRVPGHKALEQGTIQPVQVADSISDGEHRLQIQVEGGVAKLSQVYQCSSAVCCVQRQSEVDRNGGGAAPTLRISDGENFPPRAFAARLSLSGRKAHKSFEQLGGGSRALDEFTRTRPHRADNYLRLLNAAYGENRGFRALLVQQLDGAECLGRVIGRDVDDHHVRMGALHSAQHWIRTTHREGCGRLHGSSHASAVYEHLQYRTLLVVRRYYDYR